MVKWPKRKKECSRHLLKIESASGNTVKFKTPNMMDELIPPGYYMLYYVDSHGKPSIAQMVRFNDKAEAP